MKSIFCNILKNSILLSGLILYSCKPEFDSEIPPIKKQLVVDGSIENNRYANVLLTYNTAYFSNLDSASFRALVATRAKVSLSDGVKTEVLTLLRDTNFFPPYVYRSVEIKGEIGKTYSLLIEDEADTVTAQTTILNPVKADTIWFSRKNKNDSLGDLKGILSDNKGEENYYKVYTMITNKKRKYYPTLISNFEDKFFNGEKFEFTLQKGPESYLKNIGELNFKVGDTIMVKVTSIAKGEYDFWRNYEDEVLNAGNPFASNFHKVKSNVNGGLGIWCGYGVSYYRVIAK